jgi:hypothetical protein
MADAKSYQIVHGPFTRGKREKHRPQKMVPSGPTQANQIHRPSVPTESVDLNCKSSHGGSL